jgi:transposase
VTTRATLQAWEKLLRREPVEPVREFLTMHMDVWRVAQEKVGLLDKELKKASKPFERTLGRLQTTPGVGPITAATVSQRNKISSRVAMRQRTPTSLREELRK